MRFEQNPTVVRFFPRRLRKQDRPGHLLEDIFIPRFEDDRKLDPI